MILRSVALVRRHPWRAAVAVRFAYGLRLPLPIACGVARVPLLVFSIGSGISCIVWSLIFTVLGWALGETTNILLGHVRRYEPVIGAALILLMVIGYMVSRRRHMADRTAKVLARDPREPRSSAPAEKT